MVGGQRSRWEDGGDSSGEDTRKSIRKAKRRKQQQQQASKDTHYSGDAQGPHDSGDGAHTASSEPEIEEPQQEEEHPQQGMVQMLPTHLRNDFGHLTSCRQIDQCYERLNKIEEGTYGVVYRARDMSTGEIVALKHLKLEQERNGFPITSLREIHTLLLAKHPNIINVREIVVGRSLNSIYIVMDFMEHDLRALMESMREPFRPSEVKSLMLQLCSAVAHLHRNWIVHRDLKTSNLLMANGGALRVADFGLARKYASPLGHMTGLVVTLWYRAPELLFGDKSYSAAVDVWSVGCIFAELFLKQPLFQGRGEIDQIGRIFSMLGTPNEETWPGFQDLPNAKMFKFTPRPGGGRLGERLRAAGAGLTPSAYDLLARMLAFDPKQRITAEEALGHPYFSENPPPKDPSMFPTWPSRSAGERAQTP
ncbi:Pkinase-domain-containing protein [Martensiomyces pterosporus]|nr:Pkinase-domain-containing protein [Martensiomyces pterosporus]